MTLPAYKSGKFVREQCKKSEQKPGTNPEACKIESEIQVGKLFPEWNMRALKKKKKKVAGPLRTT
jgi:hypothetical protein